MAVRSTPVAQTPVDERAGTLLRRLELTVTRRLDGLLQGDHLGLVPGHGSEGGETHPYVPGDDVRRIDWNVTARSMGAHVRETIADRELETWVLVDRSPSLDFGTAAMTKAELAMSAVGAVGFLTARTGNRLGAILVEASGPTVIEARGGRTHLLSILRRLVSSPASTGGGTTDLGRAVAMLVSPPRRRGLMVIVSDFLSPTTWQQPMRALTAKHDVLAVEVVDPRELELPAVGTLAVTDPETGRTREIPTNRRTRQAYAAAAAAQRRDIADALASSGARHLRLRTDRDWVLDIVEHVHRQRRLAGTRR